MLADIVSERERTLNYKVFRQQQAVRDPGSQQKPNKEYRKQGVYIEYARETHLITKCQELWHGRSNNWVFKNKPCSGPRD